MGDIVESPAAYHLAQAEDSLGAGNLGMEKFRRDRIAFTRPSEGATDCGKQYRCHFVPLHGEYTGVRPAHRHRPIYTLVP